MQLRTQLSIIAGLFVGTAYASIATEFAARMAYMESRGESCAQSFPSAAEEYRTYVRSELLQEAAARGMSEARMADLRKTADYTMMRDALRGQDISRQDELQCKMLLKGY